MHSHCKICKYYDKTESYFMITFNVQALPSR